MTETSKQLNDLATVIESCRAKIQEPKVELSQTIECAILLLYANFILKSCEVYTLLSNNCPDGALALTRNMHEIVVIMDYLQKNPNDKDLIFRFFDSIEKVRLEQDISTFETKKLECRRMAKKDPSFVNTDIYKNTISNAEQNIQLLKSKLYVFNKKYKDFRESNGYFKDYWWAAKGLSFSKFSRLTDYEKDCYYDYACTRVHAGLFETLDRMQKDGKVAIGASDDNDIGIPLMVFTKRLVQACELFSKTFPSVDFSSEIKVLKNIEIAVLKQRNYL